MTELFAYFDQFITLNEVDRNAIADTCSLISLKKNDTLQSFGATCKTIYFIKSGIARTYYLKDANEITECFAFENNIIARVESLFTGNPSKKSIQILENAEIVAINAPKLFGLYNEHPCIERLFRLIFESAYVDTVNRIESIQFHSAEERYLALIQEPNILQRVPLKLIASYLGITQVSLSRIRASLQH
jgi:CRP-like cAMP-binding protein